MIESKMEYHAKNNDHEEDPTTSTTATTTTLSPDGTFVAILIPSNTGGSTGTSTSCITMNDTIVPFRITIWSTASRTLQSTLHYRGSSSSSSISSDVTNNTKPPSTTIFRRFLFLGSTYIAVLFTTKIIVWDIERGVIAYQIDHPPTPSKQQQNEPSQQQYPKLFVDMAVVNDHNTSSSSASSSSSLFHVLTLGYDMDQPHKLFIHEYDTTTGKLKRKIKAGKIDTGVDDEQQEEELTKKDDKKKLKKKEKMETATTTTTSIATAASLLLSTIRLAVTMDCFLLIAPTMWGIRVLNRNDGKKISKISESKFTNTKTKNITPLLLLSVAESSNFVVLVHQNHIMMINYMTGTILKQDIVSNSESTTKTNLERISHSEQIHSIQMIPQQQQQKTTTTSDDRYYVLVNERNVFAITIHNDKSSTYALLSHNLLPFADRIVMNKTNPINCVTYMMTPSNLSLLFILTNHQMGGQNQLQTIPISTVSNNNNNINNIIDWIDSNVSSKRLTTTVSDDTDEKNKRKSMSDNERVVPPTTLPVVATNSTTTDSTTSNKKLKEQEIRNNIENDDNDDDDDEEAPTVGERLKWLQEAMESDDDEEDNDKDQMTKKMMNTAEEDDAAYQLVMSQQGTKNNNQNKVTTESLTQLVQQALHSSDDAMFELVLAVTDIYMIQNTIKEMNSYDVSVFIVQITNRIAMKPQRTARLIPWIQAIVKRAQTQKQKQQNDSSESSSLDDQQHVIDLVNQLRPLQNLLLQRVEVYTDFIQLQNRLNYMMP